MLRGWSNGRAGVVREQREMLDKFRQAPHPQRGGNTFVTGR